MNGLGSCSTCACSRHYKEGEYPWKCSKTGDTYIEKYGYDNKCSLHEDKESKKKVEEA